MYPLPFHRFAMKSRAGEATLAEFARRLPAPASRQPGSRFSRLEAGARRGRGLLAGAGPEDGAGPAGQARLAHRQQLGSAAAAAGAQPGRSGYGGALK